MEEKLTIFTAYKRRRSNFGDIDLLLTHPGVNVKGKLPVQICIIYGSTMFRCYWMFVKLLIIERWPPLIIVLLRGGQFMIDQNHDIHSLRTIDKILNFRVCPRICTVLFLERCLIYFCYIMTGLPIKASGIIMVNLMKLITNVHNCHIKQLSG